MNLIEYIEKESGMNSPEWLRETIERYFAERTAETTQNVPNDDLISRKSANDALHTWFADGFEEDRWWNSTHVLAAIEGVPSAQPERKKGKWIWHTSDIWECSECGRRTHVDECMEKPMYEWCPYCGAEMKGEQE